MLKTKNNEESEFGLVQMYTKDSKSNIIAYLVGSSNKTEQNLTIYKFSSDSNILGPTQLDNQIEQDDVISQEIEELNVTGAKITKKIIIVPINNTLLYVEPIYQTILNESNVPSLKKVIVSSGTKMAIGNNLSEALTNLLSQHALDIEINTTDDIEALIQSIIKANKNLTQSTQGNNWEMIGNDLSELQELINSLDKMIKENEEDEKATEEIDVEGTDSQQNALRTIQNSDENTNITE